MTDDEETEFILLIDGHVDNGVRVIEGIQRKMGAG